MNPYFEQTILNADPVDLIRMLYQRAISSVRDAREHLRHKRIAERSAAIMRAYAAIAGVAGRARPEVAPELSARCRISISTCSSVFWRRTCNRPTRPGRSARAADDPRRRLVGRGGETGPIEQTAGGAQWKRGARLDQESGSG